MTPEEARALLEADRASAARRLASLTEDFDAIVAASQDTNADDEHDPEGATIAFERSQVDALVGQTRRRLGEVDDALERLEQGDYGTCRACGRQIPDERLAARPTALTCVTCPKP